jgi:hypothetical protein
MSDGYHGPTLLIGPPRPVDAEVIFTVLQQASVFVPLGMPRPPSRDEIDTRRWPFVGWHEGGITPVELLVARHRTRGEPRSLWLHYGWDHPSDSTRELDTVVLGENPTAGEYFEGLVLATIYLLTRGGARRLRWRVMGAGGGATGTVFTRLGVRSLGEVEDTDPTNGQAVTKSIYEITPAELAHIAERVELVEALTQEGFDLDMSTFLARLRATA